MEYSVANGLAYTATQTVTGTANCLSQYTNRRLWKRIRLFAAVCFSSQIFMFFHVIVWTTTVLALLGDSTPVDHETQLQWFLSCTLQYEGRVLY